MKKNDRGDETDKYLTLLTDEEQEFIKRWTRRMHKQTRTEFIVCLLNILDEYKYEKER